MSGYFGVARLDGRPIEPRLLEGIAERLIFRGPHGSGSWQKNGVGGCFTLLQTGTAPQADRQPVEHAGRFFLWGDVRLDGRAGLCAQLGGTDGKVDSGESSEVLLLRAWDKWGEAALERVIGDFSFALWDDKEASLFCARDFVGARPLYYARTGDALYFGNTLDVFLDVPEISRELDEMFIADFLLDGFSADQERTAFRDVHRLPAGHLLKFSKQGMQVRRFCKLPVEDPLRFRHEQEYLDAYLDLLHEAVSDRLPQGATALYLSGGLDSGSVCAIAAGIAAERGQKDKLRAFTLGWQPFFDDPEPKLAGTTAACLGIAHEVLTDPELVPFAGADSAEWSVPEPDQEYFLLREKKQFQAIAAHSNVVLSGDGGDEILAGQSWPYLLQLWRTRDWRRISRDFGGYLWTNRSLPPLRAGFRGKLNRWLHPKDKWRGYPGWLNTDFEARLGLKDRWGGQENRPQDDEHPLHPEAYKALHSGVWAAVLETEDAGWNRVQLETRTPLLDLRVLRFVLRLPPVPWCVNKELGRRAMKGKLPDAILGRPKTPLEIDPLDYCTLPHGWPECCADKDRARIERFVNWGKWCETLREPRGSLSWSSLRPVSILVWLKAVENRMGIK